MDAVERYRQAERLLSGRNPHAALIVVEPLVEEEPNTVAVLVLAARANFDCARLEQAERLFRRVVELDPTHHYAHARWAGRCSGAAGTARRWCTCGSRRRSTPSPGTRRRWPGPRPAWRSRAARDAIPRSCRSGTPWPPPAYAGFQLTVRTVVYPQFARVPAQAFPAYERAHQRLVTPLVGVLFGALAVTTAGLLSWAPGPGGAGRAALLGCCSASPPSARCRCTVGSRGVRPRGAPPAAALGRPARGDRPRPGGARGDSSADPVSAWWLGVPDGNRLNLPGPSSGYGVVADVPLVHVGLEPGCSAAAVPAVADCQ